MVLLFNAFFKLHLFQCVVLQAVYWNFYSTELPPIKAPVGLAPNPNLKNIRSKIGSFDNIKYKPGGGDKKVIINFFKFSPDFFFQLLKFILITVKKYHYIQEQTKSKI